MGNVYFANDGLIDLDVIRMMGVSVKGEGAIGYFGTGLKFAIATLLRTGHAVTLWRGDEPYVFTARARDIRGETFQGVFMNDEPLSFTTQLGRNWEVWQAYRELHSNTLDEGGTITDRPAKGDTVIHVSGGALHKEYLDRDRMFLTSKPVAIVDGLEVHAGVTPFIYYRGVRAGAVLAGCTMTYNLTRQMELSEDRIFKQQHMVDYYVGQGIPRIRDRDVLAGILGGSGAWDQGLAYEYCTAPSREFLDVAEQYRNNANCNPALKKMLAKHRQSVQFYEPCDMTQSEMRTLIDACALAAKLNCRLSADDVTVTETLGMGVMGLYHSGQNRIFLSRQALDNGVQFTAATCYEEWLHKAHGLKDESRAMQQFLFDRLIAVAGRLP